MKDKNNRQTDLDDNQIIYQINDFIQKNFITNNNKLILSDNTNTMGLCQGSNVDKNLEQNTQLYPSQNFNQTRNQEEKLEEIPIEEPKEKADEKPEEKQEEKSQETDPKKLHLQNNNQLEIKQVQSEYIGSDIHELKFLDMFSSNKNEIKYLNNNSINSEKQMMAIKELHDESTQQITNPDLQIKNESPQKYQLKHDFIQSNVRQLVQQYKQIQK